MSFFYKFYISVAYNSFFILMMNTHIFILFKQIEKNMCLFTLFRSI